jgi:hypothetical protein
MTVNYGMTKLVNPKVLVQSVTSTKNKINCSGKHEKEFLGS